MWIYWGSERTNFWVSIKFIDWINECNNDKKAKDALQVQSSPDLSVFFPTVLSGEAKALVAE